nr:MAG TPA: hypothetical protein [Caudoviricetes sp.]
MHKSCAIVIRHWQNPVPGLASRITSRRTTRALRVFLCAMHGHTSLWWAGQGSERTPVPTRPVRQPCPVHHQ